MEKQQTDNRKPTSVVVNDDVTQLNVLSGLLESEGHRVRCFESAEAALKTLLRNGPPDLIVTDLYMPVIDGWLFCRLLHHKDRFSGTVFSYG